MKRILLATDLSARSDRALARSCDLARSQDAHLTVLHVVDEDLPGKVRTQLLSAAETEIEAALAAGGRSPGADLSVRVVAGRGHVTILDTAAQDKSDLIVLGRHRDESTDRPLRGTTMERVVRQGHTPVLVVTDRSDGPYRKAMFGIDFSVFSRFALKAGFTVAPDAEFYFVHAFQVPFEGFLSGGAVQHEVRREREAILSRIIDEEMDVLLRTGGAGARGDRQFHRVMRNGEVISVLRAEAARIKPDLIVIGTHGRTGIAHALLGSVAENLLNQPPCDVLAVKAW